MKPDELEKNNPCKKYIGSTEEACKKCGWSFNAHQKPKTDPLEEMAMEFVVMAQSEQGLSQPQECALEISKSLRTLRSKTLEERPPFCIACEPRIEELKILQARIKELENEKHLENIRVVQAARILELEDKLKTIRSKTRKEDAQIAEDYHWEIKWRGEPHKKTKAGVTGEDIAKAILKKEEEEIQVQVV